MIFFLLAEYESKKMWSKCDNVTPAYLMERDKKKFNEENLNYFSVFSAFFFPEKYFVPSQTSNNEFFLNKKMF